MISVWRNLLAPVAVAIVCVACASQRSPSIFARDGVLSREAIELRADGTFVYCAFSDDGPTVFSARGTWRWVDRGRQLETVVVSRIVERGYPSPGDDLPDIVIWTAGENTLQRANRPVMNRTAVAVPVQGDCILTVR